MSDDEKAAFYFRNWRDIEAWAALRKGAGEALRNALVSAREGRMSDPDYPGLEDRCFGDGALLPIRGAEGVLGVGLQWDRSFWPWMALVTSGTGQGFDYAALRARTQQVCAGHGLTERGNQFIWKRLVEPLDTKLFDVDDYAESTFATVRAAWLDLSELLSESGSV